MIENVTSAPAHQNPNRLGGPSSDVAGDAKRETRLQREQRLHGRLMNWLVQERQKQSANRVEMSIDEDFYDGDQWTDEDKLALMARGQMPLVFNQIKPTINWLLGTERRTRIEGKVLPREEDDEEGAQVKNKLLKYLSDANKTPWSRSAAFKQQITAGLGWMEDSISTDPADELLRTRHVDWKNIYHDSNSKEMDLSDARYLFRWTWVDLDQAIALIPAKAPALKSAALDDQQVQSDEDNVYYMGSRVTEPGADYARGMSRGMAGGFTEGVRERVKLIECWYRMPVAIKICRSQDQEARHFDGEKYDSKNPEMARLKAEGFITVADHVTQELRVAIMTESVLLFDGPSPYKHNRFPFTPLWCYRRAKDGMPYGVIRDIRDAQMDYNKRASKALYILSTVRVIAEQGAVDDLDELRAEIARPDAIIEVKQNRKIEIQQDKQLAEQHLKLMTFDGQMIRDVGGVTDQNLGNTQDGMSGLAIGKLQDQGTIVTAAIFDNLRLANQLQSEIQLSLMEQYYSAERVVRIVGENKPTEWLPINKWDEQAGKYINDITRSKADYIVAEQDFRASTRQAMFESMMELVGKLPPEIGIKLLDMVIDFADVPNKEEIVARIRKINGQSDPSRKPTPEELAAQQVAQKKAEELEQLNIDKLRAEVAEAQAKTETALAQAQKTAAETEKAIAAGIELGVKAAYQAIQAAQIVAQVPGATPTADAILAGAKDIARGTPEPIQEPDVAAMPMPPEQAAQPIPDLQQADGAMTGIVTPEADGIR